MASSYLELIRKVQPDGPYLLGGWSLGGVVAFEMARQLRDAGEDVPLFIAIDSEAPGRSRPSRRTEDGEVLSEFLQNLTRDLGGHGEAPLKKLRGLPLNEAWPLARRPVAGEPGLPARHRAGAFRALWDVFRANYLALEQYVARPSPHRLLLFRAEGTALDPTLGWSGLALGGVTTVSVPGDHYTVLRGGGLEILAHRLRTELDEV